MNPAGHDSLPLGPGVRLLTAHATGLIALEKPEGVLSHPNGPGVAKNALLAAPYDAERECYRFPDTDGRERRVWLLNRLDSPTSGVVLIAADEVLAKTVGELFARHVVDKTYHAVVKGARLTPDKGVWRDRLKKAHGGDGAYVRAAAGGGIEAVTQFAWQRANRDLPGLALVKLEPKTGRTHQLRIQSALHGHPILGDKTYGEFPMNKTIAARDPRFDRLFLHCSKTTFRYEHDGRSHDFLAESPLPAAFEAVLGAGSAAPKTTVAGGLQVRLKPKHGGR